MNDLHLTAVFTLQVFALGLACQNTKFLEMLEPEMFCDGEIRDIIEEMKTESSLGNLGVLARRWLFGLGIPDIKEEDVGQPVAHNIVEKLTWDAKFARATRGLHIMLELLKGMEDPPIGDKIAFLRELNRKWE